MTQHQLEVGCNSDIQIVGQELIKVTRQTYATYGEAAQVADDVAHYAAQLDTEPLRVVPLHDVRVQRDENADVYRVRHAYELIDGPSLSQLQGEQRHGAVCDILSQVALMGTVSARDINTLAVPIDAKVQNFHTDKNGPALVDIFPALTRRNDGSFPADKMGAKHGNSFIKSMGTKSGVIVKVLSSAIDRGDTPQAKVAHILRNTDDWCYDALPTGLEPRIKSAVRREISLHFIPFLFLSARHMVHARLER